MTGSEPQDERVEALATTEEPAAVAEALGTLEPDDLDGHTVDELTDYLDAGMTPPDPTIDDSAACQNVLAAIIRLRRATVESFDDDARSEAPADEGWLTSLMSNITIEARAGRDIPYSAASAHDVGSVTEGAVRSLVRTAGDSVPGVIVERCELDGDVSEPGAPVRVAVALTVVFGSPMTDLADEVRAAVRAALERQTELDVVAVDVTVRDVIMHEDGAGR